jgi:UDP-3-O-[3-hydroxymyristoyl] glucosamine N-acyltransferase
VKLAELAVRFGCELRGDPDIEIESVAPLGAATQHTISFLASPRYRAQLRQTQAGAVICDAAAAADSPVAVLVSESPHACFARVAALLHPQPGVPPGRHPSAVIAGDASIDPSAHIGPHCVIGAGVRIGPRSVLGPGCIVETGAVVGSDVHLVARVTVCREVSLGDRCIVQPGAVLGADGFGYAPEHGTWVKVPQVGSVRIGVDVEIGANTTVDRGAIGDTIIEDGVKLDNQIQIGHNVVIGAHTAMAACVGVSGSTKIGRRCQIGGAVGIVGHLTICDDVIVTGYTMVSSSIATPGVYSSGLPATVAADWRRIVGRLRRIDGMADRLRAVERKLGESAQSDDDL